jgi:hypothetical protein
LKQKHESDQICFENAILKIDETHLSKKFGLNFLPAPSGFDFIPVDGSKDNGVDALKHSFLHKNREKSIFQYSAELVNNKLSKS